LVKNPNHVLYEYKDDETIVLGDFSSDEEAFDGNET
jgi:hypothetical protein